MMRIMNSTATTVSSASARLLLIFLITTSRRTSTVCDAFGLSTSSSSPSPSFSSSFAVGSIGNSLRKMTITGPSSCCSTRCLIATTSHHSITTDDDTTNELIEEKEKKLNPEFLKVKEIIMDKVRSSTKLESNMDAFLNHFVTEYAQAVQDSKSYPPELVATNILSVIEFGMKYGNPKSPHHYKFDVTHDAIRKPFDYYKWGCDFFRPVMDLQNSVVLGEENAKKAFDYIEQGENVVFLANHQSEADPQVFSILLESIGYGKEASDVVYIAGHKVTTDMLAVAFSMGRNLLCIHSKKHINSDPETKPLKSKQNLKTMSAMTTMMKKGGVALWVAPSGGRDRRDVETCTVPIAKFDQKTIDMFRLIGNKSKTPTHFFPLAMVSYELCPPPDSVESTTGEARNVRFSPIGICVGDEIPNVGGVDKRHLFTEKVQQECEDDYYRTLDAITEKIEKNTNKK